MQDADIVGHVPSLSPWVGGKEDCVSFSLI